MSIIPTVPLTIGGVLDASIKLYGRALNRLAPLMVCSAVLGAGSGVIRVLVDPRIQAIAAGQIPQAGTGPGAVGLAVSIAVLAVSMALLGAITVVINETANGIAQSDFSTSLGTGVRLMGPLVGGMLLYIVLMMIGLVLLLVPGFYLMISLALYSTLIIVENAGVISALKRSHALVKGHWWRLATILTVASLLAAAVFFGIGLLAGLAIPLTGAFAHAGGSTAPIVIGIIVVFIVNGIMSALMTPLFVSVLLISYHDLMLRRSGSDLAERMTASI